MASITSPPVSPVSQPITTAPRLGSPARFALAIKLLQTKPSSLSISEYFALLRANTVSGGRALNNISERRQIEACEFWRKRSEAETARVVELQARVNELMGNFNALTETNMANHQFSKSTEDQGEELVKKKAKKTTPKKSNVRKDVKRAENLAGGQKKPQQQVQAVVIEEGFFDEASSLFSGSSIPNLVLSLRLLHFAREPHLISKTITQASEALQKVIEDFIHGRLSTAVPPTHLTRGATATQEKELKEIASFSQIVERSSNKILSALSTLVVSLKGPGKDDGRAGANDQFITGGICAVVKSHVGILSLLHKNSIALLSATLSPAPSTGISHIKDVRLELTIVLIRQLKSLNTELDYQRNILEGIFYHILEISGGILLNSFIGASKGSDEAEILMKLAVEETSWYLLRILEVALPIVTCYMGFEDRKFEDKARERLKGMLIKSLFGSKTDEGGTAGGKRKKRENQEAGLWECLEGSRFCSDASIIESPFSRVLWDLLGLDILSSDDTNGTGR